MLIAVNACSFGAMGFNKNRGHLRLQHWDYRTAAAYFVTICTKNRIHYFGDISRGEMQLSATGILADVFWHEMKHHAQSVQLDAFVVMPNHIHGVLWLLEETSTTDPDLAMEAQKSGLLRSPFAVRQALNESPRTKRFQNIGKNSLSSIVGSYKSAVTRHARRLGQEFAWQPRFHETIIRDETSYCRIADYIKNNPRNWKEDCYRY